MASRVGGKTRPGFLVADVFCDGTLTLRQIQYFLRKVQLLGSLRKVVPFPVFVAVAHHWVF